jgi:hypothetical protein
LGKGIGTMTSTVLQIVLNSTQEFCKNWKLKLDVEKEKTLMFKKKSKLSKIKKRRPGSEEMEETRFTYVSVILGSMGKKEKMRKHIAIKGKV